MLPFKPISLADREAFNKYFYNAPDRGCEYSFANLYIWQGIYNTVSLVVEGFLFVRFQEDVQSYLFPVGEGDLAAAINTVIADCEERGVPFHMVVSREEDKQQLETLFPGRFSFESNRDYGEYIYSAADLIELKGKKFHAKRNHFSRFMKTYPDHAFEDITPENVEEVIAFNDRWYDAFSEGEEGLAEERTASRIALTEMQAIGLSGGLVRVDGQVQAFALGSAINKDTFCVHIEKANYDIVGSYPAVNRMFAERFCKDCAFINREEDLGDEGLRKAKLSYHPVKITEKYVVVLK